MDSITKIFKERATLERIAIKSERDELIRNFDGKVQLKDKKTKELRNATLSEIALILRYCPTNQLYAFYNDCSKAKTFGKFFWWSVKKKGR